MVEFHSHIIGDLLDDPPNGTGLVILSSGLGLSKLISSLLLLLSSHPSFKSQLLHHFHPNPIPPTASTPPATSSSSPPASSSSISSPPTSPESSSPPSTPSPKPPPRPSSSGSSGCSTRRRSSARFPTSRIPWWPDLRKRRSAWWGFRRRLLRSWMEMRKTNKVDVEDLTVENGLFKSFDEIARRQLDPIWHTLGKKTKQLVSDLKTPKALVRSCEKNGKTTCWARESRGTSCDRI